MSCIADGTFREPDLLLVRAAADSRRGNRFWTGADLVVEIVSPDQPERDIVQKRRDYAGAEIPEYWIVDPRAAEVTVLSYRAGNSMSSTAPSPGERKPIRPCCPVWPSTSARCSDAASA